MKRFTETEKWRDPWFRRLEPNLKCLWCYLNDICDGCGVLSLDKDLASFSIGIEVDWNAAFKAFQERLIDIGNGQMFLPGFISEQYVELRETCKPHQYVLNLLKKHQLNQRLPKGYAYPYHTLGIGYTYSMDTLKDKDKDKDQEQEQDKDKGGAVSKFTKPTPQEVAEYAKSIDFNLDGQLFCDSYEAKGWMIGKNKMKNWKASVRTWKTNRKLEAGSAQKKVLPSYEDLYE